MSWERLPDVPVDSIFSGFSNAIMINDKEFMISPEYFEHEYFFKYNTRSNTWNNFIKYENMALSAHQISLNKETQDLYIFGQGTVMHKLNLVTKFLTRSIDVFNTGGNVVAAFANGEYHVMGGWNNNHHLIWDENESEFEAFHEFTEWKNGAQCCGLIYVPSKELFFLFGGFDKGGEQYFDTIWLYSLQTKKWETADVTLPYKMYDFGHVLTNDEKYIVLFGGSGTQYREQIWIFDVDSMKFSMSKIYCPNSSFGCRAIITPDDYVHLLYSNESREHWTIRMKEIMPWYRIELVFGYVKLMWHELELPGNLFFPDELVRIIHRYY